MVVKNIVISTFISLIAIAMIHFTSLYNPFIPLINILRVVQMKEYLSLFDRAVGVHQTKKVGNH